MSTYLVGHAKPHLLQKSTPLHVTPVLVKSSSVQFNAVGMTASASHIFPALVHVAVQDSSKAP